MNTLRKTILVSLTTFMLGCEAVGPALTALAINFGQDLIAAASVNHAPRYAQEVESLLVALARQTTGLNMQATLAQNGYQRPAPAYAQNQQANQGYYNNTTQQTNPYGQSNDPYAQQNDPYAQSNDPYGQQNDPYAQTNDPYGQQTNDPYGQQTNDPYGQQTNDPYGQQTNDPYGQQSNDPYAQANDPYAQPSDPYGQASDPYGQVSDPYAENAVRSLAPIELEASILAQRAGSSRLVAIEDGEVLRDGGADPASGDLLKVHFSVNCACYVYVIGVDATGYVAQIYPDASEGHQNPVTPGQGYLIPASDEDWWAMDTFKGVEQVFFVASYTQRDDIQQVLTRMADEPRELQTQQYQPVQQAAFVPATRGLVKVKKPAVQVSAGGVSQSITPTMFSSSEATGEVVVTRWFQHQ